MRQRQRSLPERLLREEAERRLLKWIIGLIGIPALVVIVILVAIVGLVTWLGGGIPGYQTWLGTDQARPAEWLLEITGSSFPNVLTLGDMEEESGGKAIATNYNCSNGQSSEGMECPLQFGGGVTTLSADAGLMQINSGGWPDTPKWNQVFGSGQSPYDPAKNIAEGIRELNNDTAQCGGYLEEGLSAYNTGSCENVKGLAYANQVLVNINGYEGGPEVSAWATGNYTGQTKNFLWWHWGARQWQQPYPNAQTWILVAGSYAIPDDAPWSVLWAPPSDSKSPPVTYSWRDVSPPNEVTINGQRAQLDPPGAPLMPGQEVWGIQTDQTGTFTATAEWKWQTCSGNPPVCVWHQVYATSPAITILPAQQ